MIGMDLAADRLGSTVLQMGWVPLFADGPVVFSQMQ